ncbi:hypothetical protein MGG_12509 [Pyricularia oryzae 70-15]|uniref:Secreted protein n=1 Tax=Pyricularia oryzae (strain 70-15 / ATCC MYA-4617 / FGSC 8958) TaxID=242507 RepID=A0A151V4H8_PYRO7|nr:uncharacterized protein MGG_12509 [Pyricularia oryzae 70-15]KAI7913808.1 hypothetical protein M9X92_009267 [Pyricularia oryzae]KAI7914304.1 hypothetical protein M0657_009550 [Pyricularia oryzae]KYQ30475.1 hypothetical protein MGG_12509 [Pyricularia oryzae 70-15]
MPTLALACLAGLHGARACSHGPVVIHVLLAQGLDVDEPPTNRRRARTAHHQQLKDDGRPRSCGRANPGSRAASASGSRAGQSEAGWPEIEIMCFYKLSLKT